MNRKNRLRLLLKRVCLSLGALIVVFLVLEVFMRLAGLGSPARLQPTYDRDTHDYNPGISRLHPHSSGTGDIFRVAIVGDSLTQGSGVQWDDAYPWRLERLLNLNDEQVPAEVHVIARGGLNTDDEYRMFVDRVSSFSPDLVILGIFLNDTEDWRGPGELDELRKPTEPRTPGPTASRIIRSSRLLTFIYHKADEIRRHPALARYYEALYDMEYSGWQLFVDSLGRFKTKTQEMNVPLLAVILPDMAHLENYPFHDSHEQIIKALTDLDIQHLDLREPFMGKSSTRMQAIPGIDSHPSEIAHRLIAKSLFRYLLDSGLIDKSFRPHHTSATGPGFWRIRMIKQHQPLLLDELLEESRARKSEVKGHRSDER